MNNLDAYLQQYPGHPLARWLGLMQSQIGDQQLPQHPLLMLGLGPLIGRDRFGPSDAPQEAAPVASRRPGFDWISQKLSAIRDSNASTNPFVLRSRFGSEG